MICFDNGTYYMKRIIILAIIIAVGIAAAVFIYLNPTEPTNVTVVENDNGEIDVVPVDVIQPAEEEVIPEPDDITFSHPAAFYSENISVELSAKEGAEIYFTLDGSDPVAGQSSRYLGAIDINAGTDVTAVTIKALAVADGEQSKIFTRSYVMGQDVNERFSEDTLVFVLSSDPYNLYDYEYGICVPGKIYDDYVAEHKGEEIPYNAPGNYYMSGREAERPMYVEVFESGGENVISQPAGVRVVGGYSRVVNQKSFKLIARKSYGTEEGKFHYSFFPDAVDESGMPITEYDRIVLRNGANDREFAGVRDELTQTLAREFGYPVTQHTVPAAIFLNGEYYGYSWLHENYNEDYLATQFGGSKEQYEIVSNTENPQEGSERALADYAEVMQLLEQDMTDDKVFDRFCELVDIDNLMQYYSIQIFISNKDWPGNNYKAYRYYPADGEEITSEHMDGKWRYMLFDVEYGWGLYGDGPNLNTLSDLLSGKHMSGKSRMLESLLQRKDMQQKLANTLCDLMGSTFETDYILETLEELIEISDPEQMYSLRLGRVSDWANEWTFADSREQIREFAKRRKRRVLIDLAYNFALDKEYYDISLTGAFGAEAYLNMQRTCGGVVSGSYFTEYGVPIRAEVFGEYDFVAWEINGKQYTDMEMVVTAEMCVDGKVSVKLITEKKQLHGEPLRVSQICTDKKAGWIRLSNPNAESVSTKGLYLSDSLDELSMWEIPDVKIEAGGKLLIVAKNNKTESALMQLQMSFSLKEGETLFLSDKSGNIIAQVPVPDIPEGKTLTLQESGNYTIL